MSDIHIRLAGQAGRITLQRPEALNAITYEMCSAIEDALERWRDDPLVKLIVIDALGDRAFCAGGDIADLYATGTAGDFGFGQRFWADEYRLNALIASYPKPYVAFMQGFTMGGELVYPAMAVIGLSGGAAKSPCLSVALGWCQMSAARISLPMLQATLALILASQLRG